MKLLFRNDSYELELKITKHQIKDERKSGNATNQIYFMSYNLIKMLVDMDYV